MNETRCPEQSRHLALPYGFAPEGVDLTCIDKETRSLIQQALPPRYQGILAHLLSYGTVQPQRSMDPRLLAATGKSNNEIIILYRSVDALSKSPHSQWGPETYHKAILIYERLKIIRRIFHRDYTEVRVSLLKNREIHIPELLQALHELAEEYSNAKVKGLANRVAKNLLSFRPGDSLNDATPPLTSEIQGVLTQLLKEHGIKEDKMHPMALLQASEAIRSVVTGKGEFSHGYTKTTPTNRMRQGESYQQIGEFFIQVPVEEHGQPEIAETDNAQQGDSNWQSGEFFTQAAKGVRDLTVTPGSQKGEFDATESPSFVTPHRKTLPDSEEKGEFDALYPTKSPKYGSETHIHPNLGDSVVPVSIIVQSPKINISQIKDTIIDTAAENRPYRDTRTLEEIRREAKYYEALFDNKRSRKWTGSLIKVLRETPPEAKQYAAIATLFYSYFPLPDGRKVLIPGGFFTDMCKRYRQPDALIPAEVRAWNETKQSLKEIKAALEQGLRHPAQAQCHALLDQDVLEDEMSTEESYPQPTTYDLPVPQPSGLRTWMTHDDALRLRGRILREGHAYHIQAEVARDEERPEAFVVLATWDGWQEPMRNEDEWTQYFADTKPLMQETLREVVGIS